MNTSALHFCRLSLLLVCISLPSCKETQEMQKQLDALNQKIVMAQQEMQTVDSRMAEFRPMLPATLSGDQAVKQLVVQMAASVVAIENEIAQTQAAINLAEESLAISRKELETLHAADPR